MDELLKQAANGLIDAGQEAVKAIAAKTTNPFDDIAVAFANKYVDAHQAELVDMAVAKLKEILAGLFDKVRTGELTMEQVKAAIGPT